MDLRDTIYSRRAVREYAPEAIREPLMRSLIDAVIQAPSAANQQPWSFLVVSDQALLNGISRDSKAHNWRTCPETARALPPSFERPGFSVFLFFYHAPVLIVISAIAQMDVEDCSLAAQNLMLAAHAVGLGSCWIGFAQRWLATPAGKAALALPASHVPVAPIIVGHAKSPPPPVPRKAAEIRWIG